MSKEGDLLKFELKAAIAARAAIEASSPRMQAAQPSVRVPEHHDPEVDAWLERNPRPVPRVGVYSNPEWIAADRQVKRLSMEIAIACGNYDAEKELKEINAKANISGE